MSNKHKIKLMEEFKVRQQEKKENGEVEESICLIDNNEIEEIVEEEVVNEVKADIKLQEEIREYDEKVSSLYEYAYCGSSESFDSQIESIALMAEKEIWSNREDGNKNILKDYIIDTFARCYKLNIIEKSTNDEWSCFNTGLMTVNGQNIIGIFTKNTKCNKQEWKLVGFKTESDREFLDHFIKVPSVATYVEDNSDYYFDTNKEITLSIDNVLDSNFDSYPEEAKKLGKEVLKSLMMNAFETTKKKVKRNTRLVVPHYNNDKFGYLMPITIPVADNKYVTMALEVEKMALGNYSASTVSTKEKAYSKARLVMKPESNWLI